MIEALHPPRHAKQGDAAVVWLGLADHAVVLLINVPICRLDAKQ